MERLTTDNPNGNFETMLNFVHGKDGWAHIYDEDDNEVNLITWALNHCHDRGCDDFQCETLEEYDEALSSCMIDYMNCPIAMAYCFASQAVHLRGRLKMYEDTIPLERAKELAQAEKDGRMVVLPCKVGDTVYVTYGEGYKVCIVDRIHVIANNQVQVRIRDLLTETLWLSVSKFDKTVFRTREEAETALKKREEADNETD